jgi:hypothetical protein
VVVFAAVLPPLDEERPGMRIACFAQRERGPSPPRDVGVAE